jgi:hypothetical protein
MKLLNCKIIGANVAPESYHKQDAERGTPEFAMSPSGIRGFLSCASRWKDGYQSPDSDSKDWGNLVDTLALTPDEFDTRYVTMPATYAAPKDHAKVKSGEIREGDPIQWNAGAKICEKWIAENVRGRETVSAVDRLECDAAAKRLLRDDTIKRFFDASERQVFIVGQVETGGVTIPVRCLIDLVPDGLGEFCNYLGDLKTTKNAGRRQFRRWAYDAGYHIQGAFDLDLFNAATGEQRDTWALVLQENYRPYQTARRYFSQEFLSIGRMAYVQALGLYANCLITGHWPDYDEMTETVGGWGVIEPEAWMAPPESFIAPPAAVAATMPEDQQEVVP